MHQQGHGFYQGLAFAIEIALEFPVRLRSTWEPWLLTWAVRIGQRLARRLAPLIKPLGGKYLSCNTTGHAFLLPSVHGRRDEAPRIGSLPALKGLHRIITSRETISSEALSGAASELLLCL